MAISDRIRWSRVALEGVVIVGSILLALGLEAWWSGVQSRRTALRELATVLTELEVTQAELEVQAGRLERNLSGTRTLLTHLESVPANSPVSVPDTLVTQVIALFVADVPTAVLDAFVSSGRLEEIRSEALKQRLLGWRPAVEDLRDDEARTRDHLDEAVVPHLRTFDIARAIDLPGRQREAGVVQLRATIELVNLLRMQSTHLLVNRIQVRDALDRLAELTVLIGDELS